VGHNIRVRYADDPVLLGCLREAWPDSGRVHDRATTTPSTTSMTPLLDGRGHVALGSSASPPT
jgi:hypothetical protein